mmetsp:Transcript_9984/g.22710  ORF Transcript_9984/g.22710 Transcript_9984/m.22710 type:complete len:216 (-) Transcript_9984:326-973(-)
MRLTRCQCLPPAPPSCLASSTCSHFSFLRIFLFLLSELGPALCWLARSSIIAHVCVLLAIAIITSRALYDSLGSVTTLHLLLHIGKKGLVCLWDMQHKRLMRHDLDKSLHDATCQHLRGGQVLIVEHLHHWLQEGANILSGQHKHDNLAEFERCPIDLSIFVFEQHQHDSDKLVHQLWGHDKAVLVDQTAECVDRSCLGVGGQRCQPRRNQRHKL